MIAVVGVAGASIYLLTRPAAPGPHTRKTVNVMDDPDLRKIVEEAVRRSQTEPDTTTTVHRAWVYSGGSFTNAAPGCRYVAIDMEWDGDRTGLDLDDLEIYDATTNESVESSVDVFLLDPDGTRIDEMSKWPASPARVRFLVICQLPAAVTAVKPAMYDDPFVKAAVPVAESGPVFEEKK